MIECVIIDSSFCADIWKVLEWIWDLDIRMTWEPSSMMKNCGIRESFSLRMNSRVSIFFCVFLVIFLFTCLIGRFFGFFGCDWLTVCRVVCTHLGKYNWCHERKKKKWIFVQGTRRISTPSILHDGDVPHVIGRAKKRTNIIFYYKGNSSEWFIYSSYKCT